MADSEMTARLGLPLVQPAQAQKHVTVNEAFARLDGLTNLVLASVTRADPPAVAADGVCWGVPADATGAWAGQDGRIAIGSNGGWVFAAAARGMRAMVADAGLPAIHDGTDWAVGALSLGAYGAGLLAGGISATVAVGSGVTVETGLIIPDGVTVIGAVGRVVDAIGGTLATWRLGHAGATDRFGSGLGTVAGSWCRGLLGQPTAYYSPAELVMTAEGGAFDGGAVRLAVHWLAMALPD